MRITVSSLLTLFILTLTPSLAFARASETSAPDFTLPTTTGRVSLADLRGKVVLVDFWASWCGPCRESFPWMGSMSERYAKDGLMIVSVNLDKEKEAADRFLSRYPASFTVAFDPAGKTAEAFHVRAMPSSFVVSRSGKILYAHEGFVPSKTATMEQHIREALAQ